MNNVNTPGGFVEGARAGSKTVTLLNIGLTFGIATVFELFWWLQKRFDIRCPLVFQTLRLFFQNFFRPPVWGGEERGSRGWSQSIGRPRIPIRINTLVYPVLGSILDT